MPKKFLLVFILLSFMFLNIKDNASAKNASNVPIAKESIRAFVQKSNNFSARKYVLGPNDVLNVSIYNMSEFTQPDVRVRPDGYVNLTYLGNCYVSGLTLEEFQNIIKEKYKEYLVDPEVSVQLVQSRPFIVYISGAVYNPGSYELNTLTNSTPYVTKPEAYIERKTPILSNVLVAAGGLAYDADLEHIKITNDLDNTTHEVDLYDLIKNSTSSQDLYLMAGDKVVVPHLVTPSAIDDKKYKLLIKSTLFQRQIPVRIIGYVTNPGLIQLNTSDSAGLNSAIAAAGGYASGAAYVPKKVYLSRLDNNGKLITKVINPMENDITIRPNDIIYVPDKFRPVVGKAFDYMTRALAPFYAFSNTYNNWDVMFRTK